MPQITVKLIITVVAVLLVVLLLIEQFTIIHIFSPLALKKTEYNSYNYLIDGVKSENYKIKYLSNSYAAEITYDTENNYFFIRDNHYRKMDSMGNEIIAIKRGELVSNPKNTHYVFTNNGVYDFSKDTIKEEIFIKIHNNKGSLVLKPESWQKHFDYYYSAAQIVVYGPVIDYDLHRYPIYFKIDNNWILLFSLGDNIDDDFDFGVTYEGYPAKFNRLIYLKDSEQDHYSNAMTKHELYMRNRPLAEFDFNYPSKFKIKKLFFQKESSFDDIKYTSIPYAWAGTAYYELMIDTDILNFKEKAAKSVLITASVQTYLNWYVLPEKYIGKTNISFLEFRYPYQDEHSGLYLINKK